MAKTISDENSSTVNASPGQAQKLEPNGIQNSGLASPISNPTSSFSSKSVTTGTYDFSAGQNRSLDIAGVIIGMSPEQVKQILTTKGYSLVTTEYGPSFDELVKIKREVIPSNRTSEFKASIKVLKFKKSLEAINVGFMSMPTHSIVASIGYTNTDFSLTPDKMRHLLIDKYGADGRRKHIVKQMVGKGGVTRDVLQKKLDTQIKFNWFNRDDALGGRVQSLIGSIRNSSRYSNKSDKLSLSLKAESESGKPFKKKKSAADCRQRRQRFKVVALTLNDIEIVSRQVSDVSACVSDLGLG